MKQARTSLFSAQRRLQTGMYAAFVSLLCVALLSSCGAPPKSEFHVPETALAAAEQNTRPASGQQTANLPAAANVELQRLPYLRNAFKEMPRVTPRGGLNDFHGMTRATVQHSAIVSNCSMDVLKAFIAKGWAPIVRVQLEGRNPEILPITSYNDSANEVYLENPTNRAKRRVSYSDFAPAWERVSRNSCVLITPQRLSEMNVRNVLGRYLPAAAFKEVRVQSR